MDCFDDHHARNHTVIPGVGTIFTQSVGSAYTSSLEHKFKAEGAEKAVMGRVLFGVRIADDGSTNWVAEEITGPSTRRLAYDDPRPKEADQIDYPREAMAEMRRLSETSSERNPTGWFFDVLGRAEHDLNRLDRDRADLVSGIGLRTRLLSDPNKPREHFVPKDQAGPGATKGYERAATADERAERRAWWAERNRIDGDRLARHDADQGRRTAMLRAIARDLRTWSRTPTGERRQSPMDVVAAAAASVDAPVATSRTQPRDDFRAPNPIVPLESPRQAPSDEVGRTIAETASTGTVDLAPHDPANSTGPAAKPGRQSRLAKQAAAISATHASSKGPVPDAAMPPFGAAMTRRGGTER